MSNGDEKMIFAFSPVSDSPDGIPVLTFLMPEAGWNYMANGMCHEFDLTNVGLPLRIVIGRCETREAGMKLLAQFNGGALKEAKDVSDIDVSFGQKRPRPN